MRLSRLAHRWLIPLVLAAAACSGPGGEARAQQKGAGEPEVELPNWGEPLRKNTQRDKRRADPRAPTPRPARRAAVETADAKEAVEADVSSRSIAITSAFTGEEVVVFGSVFNSRQPSAEAGYYDVIVVLEGMPTPLVARRKSNVGGLWVNTDSFRFESAPSYYAIASTRPIEEIADPPLLARYAIGHEYARLAPAAQSAVAAEAGELKDFRDAVIRIKRREGLYIERDYAVIFIGKSLFRASMALPANVPVGPLTARVYLFREGALLSTFQSRVRLERSGVELWIYRAAMHHPLYYGLAAVALAAMAGLLASMPFRRKTAA